MRVANCAGEIAAGLLLLNACGADANNPACQRLQTGPDTAVLASVDSGVADEPTIPAGDLRYQVTLPLQPNGVHGGWFKVSAPAGKQVVVYELGTSGAASLLIRGSTSYDGPALACGQLTSGSVIGVQADAFEVYLHSSGSPSAWFVALPSQ